MSHLISVHISEATAERLLQYARRKQRSVNETLSTVLEEWIRQNEFAYIEFCDTPNGRMAYMKASRLPVWWVDHHTIAPGVSVAGFSFESDAADSVSSEFTLASWNHATDDAGPTTMRSVLTPLQPAAVPEPSILATMLGMALVGMGTVSRRKR